MSPCDLSNSIYRSIAAVKSLRYIDDVALNKCLKSTNKRVNRFKYFVAFTRSEAVGMHASRSIIVFT